MSAAHRRGSTLRDTVFEAAPRPLWSDPVRPRLARAPLDGSVDVDVAIAGAGFTGLWTAVRLVGLEPSTRVVVIEREHVGFGASGRNGGWCSALAPMSLDDVARRTSPAAAVAMQRELIETVSEVARFCDEHRIDAELARGGWLQVARNEPQLERVRKDIAMWRRYGFGEEHLRELDVREARARVHAEGVVGAAFTPHAAALHPGRLVHGLARLAEMLGVRIVEQTEVTALEGGDRQRRPRLRTSHGDVRADVVVRALEGFTPQLRGARRDLAPVYSLMLATEPLDEATWARIGLADRETFNDARTLIIYGQRTADGRLAFGGRGAPYHFGSAIRPRFDLDESVHVSLAETLLELFPVLRDVRVTHRWGGPLGVPRDWFASVHFDRASGRAAAGGYVGDGVAASALAGRTLAELILGIETSRTTLPWVGHRSPKWEPEPLRWLGITAALALPEMIDEAELAGGTAPRRAALLRRLTHGAH